MLVRQHEEWAGQHIIALVELDLQRMRVRIVLTDEAVRERLLELEHPSGTITENFGASSPCNGEQIPGPQSLK